MFTFKNLDDVDSIELSNLRRDVRQLEDELDLLKKYLTLEKVTVENDNFFFSKTFFRKIVKGKK